MNQLRRALPQHSAEILMGLHHHGNLKIPYRDHFMPLRIKQSRRDLLKMGLLLYGCKTASTSDSHQLGSLPQNGGYKDSGLLLHNLRYENIQVPVSNLQSEKNFAKDAELVMLHALEVLNSHKYAGLRLCGAGHSYIGASVAKQAYTLDMSPFTHFEVDRSKNIVRLEAGCRFHEVSTRLNELGPNFFLPTGDCPTVGVAGYFMGGGLSLLSPLLGFGVDRVLSATIIVFAKNGENYRAKILKISPEENPELFWAVMGGGGNFGIITDLSLRYEIITDANVYRLSFAANSDNDFRQAFYDWEWLCAKGLSDSCSSKIQLDNFNNISVEGITLSSTGDVEKLQYFASRRGVSLETSPLNLNNMYRTIAGCHELSDCFRTAWTALPEYFSAKSILFENAATFSEAQFQSISQQIRNNRTLDYAYIQFTRWAGKMNQENKSVSFPHRNLVYGCQILAKTQEKEKWADGRIYDQWIDTLMQTLGPRKSAFYSHAHADIAKTPEIYFGDSWELLKKVKSTYDPDSVFSIFNAAV